MLLCHSKVSELGKGVCVNFGSDLCANEFAHNLARKTRNTGFVHVLAVDGEGTGTVLSKLVAFLINVYGSGCKTAVTVIVAKTAEIHVGNKNGSCADELLAEGIVRHK